MISGVLVRIPDHGFTKLIVFIIYFLNVRTWLNIETPHTHVIYVTKKRLK